MTVLISHRGNINGPDHAKENSVRYIYNALEKGYEVEIDVWYTDNGWYLGHDNPQYKTKFSFLAQEGLWLHCKNKEALSQLILTDTNAFWHETDQYALTTKGFIWCYPGVPVPPGGFCVALDKKLSLESIPSSWGGVCSDYIGRLGE